MLLHEIDSYFRNYDKKSYEVFSQQGAEPRSPILGCSSHALVSVCPLSFESSRSSAGGLYIAVKEELWPRTREYEVGPFWSFLYGMMVYCFSLQAPNWLQISNAWRRMCDDGFPQLVPFLKVIGDSDPYCFTPDQKIVIWRHETPTEVEEVAKSFSEVLMFEIRQLEQRKERRVNGG
jgi:hypothetical protein